jgi:hypothetical protein
MLVSTLSMTQCIRRHAEELKNDNFAALVLQNLAIIFMPNDCSSHTIVFLYGCILVCDDEEEA